MGFSLFGDLVKDTAEQRRTFFKFVFGEQATGYICIAFIHHVTRAETHKFFQWPNDLEEMLDHISAHSQQMVHAYFCPNLYAAPEITHGKKDKRFVTTCTNVWADLDTCDPRFMLKAPSILTETSPGRFHALWLLQDPVEPLVAEDISRRIAYYHADQGADKSGHDLSQLLRIPYTPNFKYGDMGTAPIVTIVQAERRIYRPTDFKEYPHTPAMKQIVDLPMPDVANADSVAVFEGYNLPMICHDLYYDEPEVGEDWSKRLHYLTKLLFENSVTLQDALTILKGAACNKFGRDGRKVEDLWNDIKRGFEDKVEYMKLAPTASSTIPELITQQEVELVLSRETFVERYMKWAEGLTDASPQYHQAGAFVILSAILAGNVNLPTSFGNIIPNLWFMILGPTTVTRKSVAMNICMRLLNEVDDQAMMATDGSLEGILMGMRDRPKQPSIFLRDEFTGLLEALAHKDYMAGFSEQLTKLYDGEPIKRLLRKETIDIRDPIFIMFVGGIKTKTQMMLTEELVMGGFFPRFLIVSAEADLSRLRPIGPPKKKDDDFREMIKNELITMYSHYRMPTEIKQNGNYIGSTPRTIEATLTPEAWDRYNKYENLMLQTALDAGLEYLMPVYDRLCKSTLKASMLIAASTQRTNDVVVTLQDLLHAIYYARFWREYASETVNGIGKSYDERLMDKIFMNVLGAGEGGVTRGELMNKYALDSKRADLIFKTMEQRGIIKTESGPKGKYYVPNN